MCIYDRDGGAILLEFDGQLNGSFPGWSVRSGRAGNHPYEAVYVSPRSTFVVAVPASPALARNLPFVNYLDSRAGAVCGLSGSG
jgi:hypothetical protein